VTEVNPETNVTLPFIKMRAGHILETVQDIERILVGIGGIYNRGGELVRPIRLSKLEEKGIRRQPSAIVLISVNPVWLIYHFSQHMRWYSFIKGTKKWKQSDPKTVYAQTLLEKGEWAFPILKGIITTPIVMTDGRILEKSGYDAESQLLVDIEEGAFPSVPITPNEDDRVRALSIVLRPLRGFPFVDETARAIAASAMLTALMRPALRTAPMHGFDAPVAGTGKSLLAEAAGLLATGTKPPAMSQGKSEEEDQKQLSVVLHSGDRVLHIDNCDRAISGDFLCSILTQEVVQARILGQSERRVLPTNTFIMASGNNLAIAGDMSRRIVICHLDAHTERPDTRRFDFDMHEEVLRNRAQIVIACLTLIRGYVNAGRPGQEALTPMGSFDDWELVRGALVWAGLPDPASMRDQIFDSDPKKDELRTIMMMWERAFKFEPKSTSDISNTITNEISDLHKKFIEVACRAGQWSSKSVGWWLRGNRHKIVDGKRFTSEVGDHKVQLWRLEATQQEVKYE
jgi:hypothetical protein